LGPPFLETPLFVETSGSAYAGGAMGEIMKVDVHNLRHDYFDVDSKISYVKKNP
jgi:hypothetical protein